MTFVADAGNLIIGYIVPFLFVLTLVVFVHEMGHFLVGRWCGVKVRAFSIGFGPELIGYTARSGTRWKLSAIPLGGYVKFAGDMNAASVPDVRELAAMDPQERAHSFPNKSVGQRAAIVAAGPIANFLLAIAIFSGSLYLYGRAVQAPLVTTVVPQSAAERAGFQPGDLVLSVNGIAIPSFADLQREVMIRPGEPIRVAVKRGEGTVNLDAVPDLKEIKSSLGTQRIGQLGISVSNDPALFHHQSYSLSESLTMGVAETWFIVERTGTYVGRLFVGRESADQLSGPIRIAQASGQVAKAGLEALLSLCALLSVSIGLINLVPIPLLDGGHLLYYAVEAIRGRPLSERAQEMGFRIGLVFVVTLMLVATWNDVIHLGSLIGTRG